MEQEQENILITKRELFELEDYIRQMWQFLPIPIAFISPLGIIMEVDEAMERLIGYTREELAGKSLFDYCSEKEKMAQVQEWTLSGKPVKNYEECSLINAQGQEVPVNLSTLVRMDEELGEPVGYFAAFIDIAERKRADETLRLQAEIMRNMAGGMVITRTKDTVIVYTNPKFEEMFGYSPGELIGKNISVVNAPTDKSPEEIANDIQRGLRGTGVWQGELYNIKKDGTPFWCYASVSTFNHHEYGDVWVATHTDITKLKQAEQRLHELYDKERRLREELEAEIARRVEFTRALVHELKTPITPVLFSSDWLLEEAKEEPFLSLAQNIYRGASNLNRRVDELLDLARGEIGILGINPQPVDVMQLLHTMVNEVMPVARRKDQSLDLEAPSSFPTIWADEDRIRQVILNLLDNAFKFTPPAGKIIVRAMEDKANLIVEVKDTGPGISREEQQRLFGPYQHLGSDRRHTGGLGIGLNLSKRLVELHGGRVWVESQKGKGSTFGFSIPLSTPSQRKKL